MKVVLQWSRSRGDELALPTPEAALIGLAGSSASAINVDDLVAITPCHEHALAMADGEERCDG